MKIKLKGGQMKIKLKGGYVPYKMPPEELEVYLRERKRGCGSHSSKKDYKRKDKYNKQW